MDNLTDVLKDFNNLLHIPICFINDKLEIVCEVGHYNDSHNIMKNTSIYNDLKINTVSITKFTYFKNIHFLVFPSLYSIHLKGFFIVGPFKSEYICNELKIPFKPLNCIDYISYILNDLISTKLNNYQKFNIYIRKTIDYVDLNYSNDLKIEDICSHLNLNKSYFCVLFKNETGYTFTKFLNRFRIEKSKQLLKDRNLSILDISLKVGFNNQNYFNTIFKKLTGKTPLQYRKNYT